MHKAQGALKQQNQESQSSAALPVSIVLSTLVKCKQGQINLNVSIGFRNYLRN